MVSGTQSGRKMEAEAVADSANLANCGDSMDKEIDRENGQRRDFIILDEQVGATEENLKKKIKLFLINAVENAEFFVKVNDDIFVNIDTLGATLSTYLNKSRAYIGCMKPCQVFSDQNKNWYEPDWWKFGDGKSYFRHASGEIMPFHKLWLSLFQSTGNSSFVQT